MAPISLPQTAPTQGQTSGSFWNVEGEQYFHQDPNGNSQNGFSDSVNSFHVGQETQPSQIHGRGSFSGSSRSPWKAELSSVGMSRQHSRDSIGARSQGTTYSSAVDSHDQFRSARMYSNDSQMSFAVPSVRSDASDRSNSPVDASLFTPTPQDIPGFDNYSYQNGEDLTGAHPLFHGNSLYAVPNPANAPGYLFSTSGDEVYVSMSAVPTSLPSQDLVPRDPLFHSGAVMHSPEWNADFLDSQRSSPVLLEDPWQLPPPQMMTSTTNSPEHYSPSLDGLSPTRYVQDFTDLVEQPPYISTGDRVTRKPIGPRQSKVISDSASTSRRQRMPPTEVLVGRSSVDFDNTAREHPLYHNVTPKADGLYHCPFEDDPKANCTHKPEKLKCNYDKFVDSHLKPYKCKINTCKDLCFSSTACLLRHEREAHAMHGHGDKPFLCEYEGCERGVTGNGFPRHWNLMDHMKRVHNDPGKPRSISGSPPASGPAPKGKKRKAGDSPETPSVEKSQKRNVTPPVVSRQPQEPTLDERFAEEREILLETVAKLQDPRNAGNMSLLRNANNSIKVMVQTTQRIHATPAMGRTTSQQSG